jgi:hypothetical protein
VSGIVGLPRFLVEHGADVKAKDKDGSTPLHQAPASGNVDLAFFLVEHGADVTAQDKKRSFFFFFFFNVYTPSYVATSVTGMLLLATAYVK